MKINKVRFWPIIDFKVVIPNFSICLNGYGALIRHISGGIMLIYGLDKFTNQCRYIRDVTTGLSCGCVCPICRTPLVAQQGKIRDWHFRHYNLVECSNALETALHFRAKEILSSANSISLPYLSINEQATLFDDGDLVESSDTVIVDHAQTIALDDIKLIEHSLGNFKPDLIVYSHGEPIIIEIAVTHFIDYEKRRKIEEKNISCIEIDMSDFIKFALTDEKFMSILIDDVEYKNWIFHKDEHAIRVTKKRELAVIYGGGIRFVNREPDGIKYGHDYSGIINQIELIP